MRRVFLRIGLSLSVIALLVLTTSIISHLWQSWLNQALDDALSYDDHGSALKWINYGADPMAIIEQEAKPHDAPEPPVWIRLSDALRGKQRYPTNRFPILVDAANTYSDAPEVVRALISRGADPNAVTSYGSAPLQYAAHNNHIQTVQALLDAGANVNRTNSSGQAALHWAHSPQIITLLLAHGANVNLVDLASHTPLWYAAGCETKESGPTVIELIAANANVNSHDRTGKTPLMRAAEYNCIGNLKALLNHGANVEAKDNRGWTAEMFAQFKYHRNVNTDASRLLHTMRLRTK